METSGGPDENAQDENEATSPPIAVRQVDEQHVVVVCASNRSDRPNRGARFAVQEPVQVSLIPIPH